LRGKRKSDIARSDPIIVLMKTYKEISSNINITMELKQLLQRRLSATESSKQKGTQQENIPSNLEWLEVR